MIPRILVDANVVKMDVSDGQLQEAESIDEVAIYDLSASRLGAAVLQGNAADPSEGNAVFFGRYDSGSVPCYSGYVPAICFAVFGSLEELSAGDEVIVLWEGSEYTYRVVTSCWMENRAGGFDPLLRNTRHRALTLMTQSGNYRPESNSYTHTLVVRANAGDDSSEMDCGPGSTSPPPSLPAEGEARPYEVQIESLTGPVSAGGEVTLSVTTGPQAECPVRVEWQGTRVLGFIGTADSDGTGSFTWRLPDHYPSGDYAITVHCGENVEERTLNVE